MATLSLFNATKDDRFNVQCSEDGEHAPNVMVQFRHEDEFEVRARFHANPPSGCRPFYTVDLGSMLDPQGAGVTLFLSPEQRLELVNALTDCKVIKAHEYDLQDQS